MTVASTEVVPPQQAVRRRVCVVSEDLSDPPDEGVKQSARALAAALGMQHDVALFSTSGDAARLSAAGVRLAPAPRTFLSPALRRAMGAHRPQLCIYVARASTTAMSFLRTRLLKAYCPGAAVVLVGLQPRRHSALGRRLVRALAPDLVCVQSPCSQAYLQRLGCRTALLPSGVDAARFCPAPPVVRDALRASLGVDGDQPLLLHVGHLQVGRGIGVLAQLALFARVVLVASSSTAQEAALAESLRRAGVTVLTDYLPRIEQLYQAADCYVFPVQRGDNAIEVPLSVLEALACDLPVIGTRFGGLPQLFDGAEPSSLTFVDTPAELVLAAARWCARRPGGEPGARRALALPFSWEAAAARLLAEVWVEGGARV